jgi:retron-type reverse transcriptase
MKHRGKGIAAKRKMLEALYRKTDFKKLKTLDRIANKAGLNPNAVFDDLMYILADKGILFQAMGNISGKSGALTPGTELDTRTVDASSNELIEEISQSLKDGTFRFKPIRRVYMDKSGKNPVTKEQKDELTKLHKQGKVTMDQIKELKARPLGISSFPDKIVQEALRMILNTIYEPEFARYNVNFGFRPNQGCQDAISHIQMYAKQMDFAIEGDIKGAFDNVCHDRMIEILEQKIKDKKFLRLIKGGLKCGVIFLNYRQDSDLGTTQGSVVSPLLYNIYFHEFDKFICTEFKEIVSKVNQEEDRKDRPINKLYNSYSKKKTKLRLKEKFTNMKNYLQENGKNGPMLPALVNEVKETMKEYKALDKEQKKLPAFARSRQTIRYWYTRYADDWVFFTNAEINRVSEWKQLFIDWIMENLKLTVSVEKTKVTNLRNGEKAKYLGYQLARQGNKRLSNVGQLKTIRTNIVKRREKKKVIITKYDRLRYKIRTTNPSLIVGWDRDRVLARLEGNGFIKKIGNTWRGKSKLPWTTLPEPEIVDRYNYIIRGYLNYYVPVTDYPTDIQFLHYLITYSCAHTLAQKRNCSLRKIFRKFGKDMTIKYIEKVEKTDKEGVNDRKEIKKTTKIINWKKCTEIMRDILIKTREKQKGKKKDSISIVKQAIDDICNVKMNWRTKYKLSEHCAICGSTDKVEYHHVKHIRKGKVTGFLQVMKQLNRRQIPCCKKCHQNIHKGAYNGMALNDLYDEELIIL